MIIAKSLTKAYKTTRKEIDLNDSTKIILFSDLHRGVGDWSDDFAHNKQIFFVCAATSFWPRLYYIKIGDELWENKDFGDVQRTYSDIFELMSMFYKEKRLHLIWGNHNRYWEKDKSVRKHLRMLVDDIKLFDGIKKVDEDDRWWRRVMDHRPKQLWTYPDVRNWIPDRMLGGNR